MNAVTQFFTSALSRFSQADFALLAVIDFTAFAAVFIAAVIFCALSPKVRSHDKKAFLYAVNAFTAVTLAVFLIRFTLAQSVAVAAVFWCVGYLCYGALCLFKPRPPAEKVGGTPIPVATYKPLRPAPVQSAPPSPAVQSGVRLEHALSIADKLLLKNLGRGDRQELEKIKTALTVLKVKGVLTAQEGESLNDMFNALLKLMAKYDL